MIHEKKKEISGILSREYLKIWALTVTAGWLGSQLIYSVGLTGNPALSIISLWLGLMVIASISSYFWINNITFHNLIAFWAVASLAGVLFNYVASARITPISLNFAYGTFWFLMIGFGFLYTSKFFNRDLKKLYIISGIINLAVAGVFYFRPLILFNSYYIIGAVIQGLPMAVHIYLD